ncbi:MAG: PAS domain-containing protein [Minwuia sp.]|uniref:PAS domain-containing protein n=1 Tax=Minwuia sp. TaxID=2493630 RepID=UPI003A868EF4
MNQSSAAQVIRQDDIVRPSGEAAGRRFQHITGALPDWRHADELVAHWCEMAGDLPAPRRRDLRPEALRRSLPYLVIFDYTDRDTITFRLAGTSFWEHHEGELTGRNFLDLQEDGSREAASRRLFGMLEHPCGIASVNSTLFESGQCGRYLIVALPLLDDDGQVAHSIHVTQYDGQIHLPSHGRLRSMGVEHARYIDIGFGIPAVSAPY